MREGSRLAPIILFTTANVDGYRSHLAGALADLGHEVSIAVARREPTVCRLGEAPRALSPLAFLAWLRTEIRRRPDTIVLNSTTLSFPATSAVLRLVCGGLWCFDLYDHFPVQFPGRFRSFRLAMAQRFLSLVSDFTVRPSYTSAEIAPNSLYLPSASHVRRVARPSPDFSRVLVLASFDLRTDWALLDRLAVLVLERRIDLIGRVDADNRPALEALVARRANVRYAGPYRDGDLDSLLASYSVMVAPYLEHVPVTRYIDPNRYRHGLNSGLEVITTEVPQARAFGDDLHVVHGPEEIAALLGRLERDPGSWRSIGRDLPCDDWREVAQRFIALAEDVRRNGRPSPRPTDELPADPRVASR